MHINASAIEKIVLFGDSLMAGYGLPKEHHLSIVLENNLKQAGLNIKVINGSVSGSTSSGGGYATPKRNGYHRLSIGGSST